MMFVSQKPGLYRKTWFLRHFSDTFLSRDDTVNAPMGIDHVTIRMVVIHPFLFVHQVAKAIGVPGFQIHGNVPILIGIGLLQKTGMSIPIIEITYQGDVIGPDGPGDLKGDPHLVIA
jgi:hypothetical protein